MRRRFLLLALANFAAIAVWTVWGINSHEWNFEVLGGIPRPHEIVKWCLILLNAPAYLVAVAVVAPFGLTLFPDYLAMNVLWAALTIPAWLAYSRLLQPVDRLLRVAFFAAAAASFSAAAWALTVAWRQGHDPHHSCWSVLALVSMLLGITILAVVPLVRSGRSQPGAARQEARRTARAD
ncbi:MAG TPA: hypothetical protein VF962_07775 [Gemmatimonadaceae bacterium]